MLRKVLAVIVGYLVLALFTGGTFAAAFAMLGMDGAFEPGSWEPSGTWLLISFVLGATAAILGGLVCAWIARSRATAMVFAGIVLVLGLALAVPTLFQDAPVTARPATATMQDAAGNARQPAWVSLLNPFVGAAGILLGARLRRQES
jgi:hypothetical protein